MLHHIGHRPFQVGLSLSRPPYVSILTTHTIELIKTHDSYQCNCINHGVWTIARKARDREWGAFDHNKKGCLFSCNCGG